MIRLAKVVRLAQFYEGQEQVSYLEVLAFGSLGTNGTVELHQNDYMGRHKKFTFSQTCSRT